MSKAPRDVRRRLSPYGKDDIRYVQTLDEEIAMYDSVTVDQIKSLYSELLSGSIGELSVVGDFDSDMIKNSINDILSDWTSKVGYVRIDRPANPEPTGDLAKIQTPDKANAFFYSSMQMELADTDSAYEPLVLGNIILGGGVLSSRLADRVRQKDGLSYTVRSALSTRAKDSRCDLLIYAIANPENKDKLIQAIKEEIDLLKKDGITEQELEDAKKYYLGNKRVQRTTDKALAGELLQTMFLDRTMEFAADHADRIEAASVESVNDAIRKYVDWDKLVKSIAGDFKAKQE